MHTNAEVRASVRIAATHWRRSRSTRSAIFREALGRKRLGIRRAAGERDDARVIDPFRESADCRRTKISCIRRQELLDHYFSSSTDVGGHEPKAHGKPRIPSARSRKPAASWPSRAADCPDIPHVFRYSSSWLCDAKRRSRRRPRSADAARGSPRPGGGEIRRDFGRHFAGVHRVVNRGRRIDVIVASRAMSIVRATWALAS